MEKSMVKYKILQKYGCPFLLWSISLAAYQANGSVSFHSELKKAILYK
jgi:hypothetical protein